MRLAFLFTKIIDFRRSSSSEEGLLVVFDELQTIQHI